MVGRVIGRTLTHSMRLDFAVLADAVTVRENLINVLGGGLTRIAAFPATGSAATPFGPAVATGAHFMVGARIFLSRGELGRPHRFESKVSLPDGGELNKMEMQIMIPTQEVPEGEEANFALAYHVSLGAIPRLGPYSVDIFLDGVHAKAIPFQIVLAPPPPAGPPQSQN